MQKRKGISLIVLVITIIVMIVLAGAIILSLNNAGIIEKANEAVKSTDEATIKELAQMAWAEAYADKVRDVDGFKARVEKVLDDNKVDMSEYGMLVTTKGVEIVRGWIQDGTVVSKGDTVINVGELVAYDETKGGTESVDKNVTWKVLGAENGELLIVSADNVIDSYGIGDYNKTGNIELAKDGLLNGISNLNAICTKYGKGVGAISSRSIKVEDVNKVTEYNPETAGSGKAQVYEYGNVVTYIWNGSTNPYITSTNGVEGRLLENEHNGSFIYYNGKEVITSTNTGATPESPKEIIKLTSKAYFYYAQTLTSSEDDEKRGLSTDSAAYKMLFRNSANTKDDNYWLASEWNTTGHLAASFGFRCVNKRMVSSSAMFNSVGAFGGYTRGVRAVVSLGTDVVFTGASAEGLTF